MGISNINFSVKAHPVVAQWVPGFIVLAMWLLGDLHHATIYSSYTAKWMRKNT